jgi:hypothetical protein
MAILNVGTGKPYATIQGAITAVDHGGTVQVHAGGVANVYAEALVVNNKRVRLFGAIDGPGISVTGAGGGAAPALLVSGTGGCFLENLKFSNVGSSATYVVQLNVSYDWISRCVIDGGATARCLLGQFGDNVLLKNGTRGMGASCSGSLLAQHFTVVNMSVYGFAAATYGSTFIGCLTANCNNLGLQGISLNNSFWCFTSDASAFQVTASKYNMPLADIDFVDYAGGDFRLKPGSLAGIPGISTLAIDGLGRKRVRQGDDCQIFGGYHDPQIFDDNAAKLAWLTGTSSIRKY